MCSNPHCQVGLSWFWENLSPANGEQRRLRWADFAKNCLPRIGPTELPQFREKYRPLGCQKMGSNMRPRYIQFRDTHDRDISGVHCMTKIWPVFKAVRMLQHAKFQAILPMHSWNARKQNIWPVSQSQNATKMTRRKINRDDQNLISSWGDQDT